MAVGSGDRMASSIAHLFVKPDHGQPMEPRQSVDAVSGKGLVGDAAFGTTRRQVLLIDAETLSSFGLLPGDVRENIVTRGVSVRGLPSGSRIEIDQVVLEVTGDCTPCDYLDRLRPGLRDEIVGQRGVLTRVVEGGTITIGSTVRVGLLSQSAGRDRG